MFILTVSLLLGCAFVTSAKNVAGNHVRLAGSVHSGQGRVEILHEGQWGTICDDSWDDMDATVICRMLSGGQSTGTAVPGPYFAYGDGPVWLSRVHCHGNESDVMTCSSDTTGGINCDHSRDAGVICSCMPDTGTTGSTSPAPVSTVALGDASKLACDFERSSSCGYTNDRTDNFDWLRDNGGTSSSGTGPDVDHTLGTSTGHYMYIETSAPRVPGDKARYISPVINTFGDICVSFYYHMVGSSMGTLNVYVKHNTGSLGRRVWTRHGNQGNTWLMGQFPVNPASHIQITFEGVRGSSYYSDIAIDDISVRRGLCGHPGVTSPAPVTAVTHGNPSTLSCNFESSNRCGYTNDLTDDFNWIGRAGGTGTGLSVDHTIGTSSGHYMYIEASSPRRAGDKARYLSPVISTNSDICVSFYYHMLGSSMGTLNVYVKHSTGSLGQPLWTRSGNQGNMWNMGRFPVNPASYVQIAFEGVVGSGYHSNIAIDDISVTQGLCRNTAPVPTSAYTEPGPCQKRLSGGTRDSEGTVLFHHAGAWHTYCDRGWDVSDARVVCRELGYWYTSPTVYSHAQFGTLGASGSSYDVSPHCSGHEGRLELCKIDLRLTRTCASTDSVGIACNPTNIDTTNVRLVDGPGPWKGRLEVKVNGNWGSFCYNTWINSSADVVCRTLNFSGPASSTYRASAGFTATHFRSLDCGGSGSNMGLCRMDPNITDCLASTRYAVGIDCSGGIDVSVSNETSLSGTVYVNTHDGTGVQTVCNSGVDDVAARVLCASAGYQNTASAWTSATSTQLPILYSSIDCAGWETHVSQCSAVNISQSGSNCTDATQLHCFNCTSQISSSTGSTTSLNYPSSYPSNLDCLIAIVPPRPMALKLQFNNLQLPGDGDYVEIKDGSKGRQLGYFTTSSDVPYLVSENGFYIRFKTNAAGTAQGFNISWSPLQISDAVHMACGPSGWDIAVNSTILRALYPGSGLSQIKLSDQHCTGRVDGDLVRFNQSYTQCATKLQVCGIERTTDTSVVYTNQLLYPDASTPFPVIVHGYRWKVEVECDVARTDTAVNSFHPNHTVAHQSTHVAGAAHYDMNVAFFTDGSYYKELMGNPLSLRTGDDVFVKLKMSSDDTHVKMRVHTCFTRPGPNADPSLVYTLIQNGCPVDSDTHIISQGTHETFFYFNAFEFPANHNNIYVYCNATYCQTSDMSAACTQTCQSSGNGGIPPVVGRSVGKWTWI